MIQRAYLVLKELLSNRFISIIVFFSILVSVFSGALFEIIGGNFNRYIQNRFASSIPPNTIKVSPKPARTLFFFQIKDPGSKTLSNVVLKKIKRLGGVKVIYPVMASRVPMQARLNFLGFRYRTDLISYGLPLELIKEDIKKRKNRKMWKKPDFENRIPVLIPRNLLKAYNDGLALPNRLPTVKESWAVGRDFLLRFNYSSLRRMENITEVKAEIAGFTDKVKAIALLIPLEAAKYYNRKYNDDDSHREYIYAFVKVRDHKALLRVSRRIKKMGFLVEVEKSLSKHILDLKRNVNLVIRSLMTLIIILSIIAISFSTVIATLNRIEYYRIMRVVGSSKIFITFTIIVKYLILGFIASYAGLILIKYLSNEITRFVNISVIKVSLSISKNLYWRIILFGTLIPVLSTIPALFRLYTKDLSRD
ncbi:ABC transporter permease [Spirochaetota bacterium]